MSRLILLRIKELAIASSPSGTGLSFATRKLPQPGGEERGLRRRAHERSEVAGRSADAARNAIALPTCASARRPAKCRVRGFEKKRCWSVPSPSSGGRQGVQD